MSHIRSAATPIRRRKSLTGASPHTPVNGEEGGGFRVAGTAVTPMKRVPILANFEEWMKMATDNVRVSSAPFGIGLRTRKVLTRETENKCAELVELCANRLFP